MYTNAGVLAMMTTKDIAVTFMQVQATLNEVEKGRAEIEKADFDMLARWEEDIKDHFVRRTELLGMTNVSNDAMALP